MARFDFAFDANQFEDTQKEPTPGGDFQLIPHGTKCWFEIIEASIVPTSKGGSQLLYTAEIKAPAEYERRKVWGRLNIECPSSQEAETYARRELAALCRAIGISVPEDTDDLLGKPFEGTIRIKREKGKNPTTGLPKKPQNAIGYYKPAGASAPVQQAPKPAPKPAATGRKPWERAA